MSEIRTLEQLAELYPNEPTKAAITKECDRITPYYQALIETSPFLVIATARAPQLRQCVTWMETPVPQEFWDELDQPSA
mgnify:CR=1 FL=1